MPRYEPQSCANPECKSIIKGSMFVSNGKSGPGIICEDCYFARHYGSDSYTKAYKHCILSDVITPEISRKICRCRDVPHYDGSGRPLSLFPVNKGTKHIDTGGLRCGLLELGKSVTLAKYEGLQAIVGAKKWNSTAAIVSKFGLGKTSPEKLLVTTTGSSSTGDAPVEAQSDKDVPVFFRKFATKNPFGHVHMALRVGPLIIENGVSQYVIPLAKR